MIPDIDEEKRIPLNIVFCSKKSAITNKWSKNEISCSENNWAELATKCLKKPINKMFQVDMFLMLAYGERCDKLCFLSKFDFCKNLLTKIAELKESLISLIILEGSRTYSNINNVIITPNDFMKSSFYKENDIKNTANLISFDIDYLEQIEHTLYDDINDLNQEQNEKIINIKSEVKSKIFECLKGYLNSSDISKLSQSIDGYKINEPILFSGSQKQLCVLFRRLKLQKYISDDFVSIQRWLVNNFTYTYRGKVTNFNEKSVHEYLTKFDKSIMKKSSQICVCDSIPI